jgi:hypothetical protein
MFITGRQGAGSTGRSQRAGAEGDTYGMAEAESVVVDAHLTVRSGPKHSS